MTTMMVAVLRMTTDKNCWFESTLAPKVVRKIKTSRVYPPIVHSFSSIINNYYCKRLRGMGIFGDRRGNGKSASGNEAREFLVGKRRCP